MKISQQVLDLFPIPSFLVQINDFDIVLFNDKVLTLTNLKKTSFRNYKMSDFVDQSLLKTGEYQNIKFNVNEKVVASGILTVQSHNENFLIVSFNKTTVNFEKPSKKKLLGILKDEFESRYKSFIDNSADSIFIMQKGIIQYVNPRLIEISGYTSSMLIGKKFTDFVAPEELKKVNSFFIKRLKGEKTPMVYESIAKVKNGENVEVEVNVYNIVYKGEPAQQVILKDITKRKRAERRYRDIIDFAPIGFYQSTRDGKFILANNELAQILGFDNKEELISKNISEFYFSTDEREKLIEKYDRPEKSEVKNVEIKFRKKDGSPVWVLMTARAIKDIGKNTLNYDGFIVDITDRKTHEQEIMRLYKAIDQSPSPVALTDLNGHLAFVNPKYCELSGYSKEELIGSSTRIFKSGVHSKSFYKKLWKTILSGKTWEGELVNRKKNGELFIESAKISPVFNEKGEPTQFIKASNDITEERKIKNELIKAKEKAEESDRLKSAFLANMSHEIRTPMNGILGFSNLLLETNLKDEERKEYIKIINQSGERLLNTVSDIIEISKIEAGVVDVKNSIFNLNETLNEIVNFFQPQAKDKDLEIVFKKEIPERNINVDIDKVKFESIITNLIKNAIKYTDKGLITVSYFIKDEEIRFSVKDTGIGIPKHRIEAIFNRFEQADIEDKRALEGSGLGLSIAKSFVEMLGGKIWVESVENKGSEFYFTIPFLFEADENQKKPNNDNVSGSINSMKDKKLLIVDDDESSVIYLEEILKGIVGEVFHVKNGNQAIEKCKTDSSIDIVLMDIKMPGLDGYETTRRIREFNKDIKIIAQTAYALVGDKEKAIASGCDDYISKPIKKNEILEKIKRSL